MKLIVSILALALASACGTCGCGFGFGCRTLGFTPLLRSGLGWVGPFGGYRGLLGGFPACAVLCGSELSEEELDELCCGDCCSDEYCYELCAPEGSNGLGACGGFGFGQRGFPAWGFGNQRCWNFQPVCRFVQPVCGWNGMGQGGYGGCVPIRFAPVPVCAAPRGYVQGNNLANRQICGHSNANSANTYGVGGNDCGYNQGGVCASYNNAYMNADSCRRSGERGFNRKFSDEFLVRKSNEACDTGDDCYDASRANLCTGAARVAGNRSCGNANACYNNAAGIRCADNGVAAQGGCFRTGAYGCGC